MEMGVEMEKNNAYHVDFAVPESRIVLERSKLLGFSPLRRGIKHKW